MPEFPTIKRVCIYGAGGVGGYFGGKIAEVFQREKAKQQEIYFIARGEHLKAIQQNGIRVITPERIIESRPAKATDDFSEIPTPDLILLCTKSYDLPGAAESIKRNIHKTTVIIPLLNGVDIYQRIRSILRTVIVLPSCLYLGTHIEKPGTIHQGGGNGIILSGKDPLYPDYEAENLRQFFDEAGIGFSFNSDPYPEIWQKYVFIASFGLVTACSGKTLGEAAEDEKLRDTVRGIVKEIVSIAEKKKILLPADIIEKTMNKASSFPKEARTSYQRDVELWPRPNEGDLFGGTILREGAALGIPTPATERVYSMILEREKTG